MTHLMVESRTRRQSKRLSEEKRGEKNIAKLLARAPNWMSRSIEHLRQPRAIWIRVPVALVLILSGFVSFLPVLGLWMLPLGLLLLTVDIPILRHLMYSLINWIADKRPQWFR